MAAVTEFAARVAAWQGARWRGLPRSARLIWTLIGGIGLLDLTGIVATGMRVAPGPLLLHLLAPVALLGVAAFYDASGRSPRIARTLAAIGQLFAFTLVAGTASYLLIGIGMPFVDASLVRLDAAAGLDWPAYNQFVARLGVWPNLALALLYASSVPQIMAVAAFLGFSGRFERMVEFVGCLMLTAVCVVVLGALFPALGAHHAYGIADGGRAFFVSDIIAAHDRQVTTLDVSRMTGLVTFPSFHTAISLLLIAATWGLRWIGPVALLVNLALLAGVPVYGSHHFIDMIGGAVITVLALWLWRTRLTARGEAAG
jgi:hypothetical protein